VENLFFELLVCSDIFIMVVVLVVASKQAHEFGWIIGFLGSVGIWILQVLGSPF
jgi:hypothetical protein